MSFLNKNPPSRVDKVVLNKDNLYFKKAVGTFILL